ncbi:hypothetical protein RVR_21 [Actinacidiphila reveromycinica]|uniref:Uncharacterized protein n=1 Tax=Actinacidiphila reveromycinica TaxID=659352 RepID=A0A7U3VL71_9ACTN|nr:hypothetical protein [Streptomyces sp. SN-593]BBA95240.1 hypothetical protein RVR_21 [Streptomyces sp. SN-593]
MDERPTGRLGRPPVALVFIGAGRTVLASRINRVLNLTAEHWQHSFLDLHTGPGKVPLLVAALDDLTAHGPQGPVWHRAGATVPSAGWLQRWTTPPSESLP